MADANKYDGMWDFGGSCAPPENGSWNGPNYKTFTLGCFQWERKATGKGLKKGPVRYRVNGLYSDPATAYAAARMYCAEKNKAAQRKGE